jgi:CRP/FNR family cyclic AMP-dependent transcriptional regulator
MDAMTPALDINGQFPLLAAVPPTDLAALEQSLEHRSFAPGAAIVEEGKTDQSLWLLRQGTCEVSKQINAHGMQQLAVLEPGHVFGEMSFLHPAPHCATVRALTHVEASRLSPAAFERLRGQSPQLAAGIVTGLVQLISDRLRTMNDRVCAAHNGHAPEPHSHEWHDFRARLFAGDFN